MRQNIQEKFKLTFVPRSENQYRPKFLDGNFLIYCALLLVFLKLATFSALFYFPINTFFADLTKIALVELTNEERQSLGFSVLRSDAQLEEAAQKKAQDMMNYDYFSHQSPAGKTPWHWLEKVGYNYEFAGENLAIGFLDSDEVFHAWKNSILHKKNIINPKYQDIGIAVLEGDFQGKEVTVVVQLFGARAEEKRKIILAAEQDAGFIETEKMSPIESEIHPLETQESSITETEKIEETEEEPKDVAGASNDFQQKDSQKLQIGFFSFIAKNYLKILTGATVCLLLLIIITLLLTVIIKPEIQYPDVVFRSAIFILILTAFILIDKQTIIQFISHNPSIF